MLYRLARMRGFLTPIGTPVYIDNRQLDGFIDRFLQESCRDCDCETCRYCHRWAERVVRIDPEWRAECLALYERLFREMETGTLWR